MSKVIELAKFASDAINGSESFITDDLKTIFKTINKNIDGVIIELPWDIDVNGEYQKSITIVATKVDQERIYFINPVKVSDTPTIITENDQKGPPRIIEVNGYESMLISDLEKISKVTPVLGLIRE